MKSHLFSIFTLLALMVSSCGYDEMLENRHQSLSQDNLEFVSSFEEMNESRTYIEEDAQTSKLYLRWTKADEISIFRGTTLNQRFQFSGETGDNSGSFKLVPNDDFVSSNELDEFRNYAFYPYDENTKITEKGVFAVTMPATQKYAENSFGLGANSMVAVTETIGDADLKFKNVCGYFKFKFYGDNLTIKSVTLKGNNGEKLAGKAQVVSGFSKNPIITMSDESTDELALQCGNGIKVGSTKEKATEFWFVVPPTKFTKGFTITVTDTNDGIFTKTTEKIFEIKRNTIKPISAMKVETEVDWEVIYAKERAALIDLYNALDGDNWDYNRYWCSDRELNAWSGVTTNAEGRVIHLKLQGKNSNGNNAYIPESIGDLTALEELNMRSNYLSGDIPESIGKLKALKKLYLGWNNVSGNIPESIGNLTSLETLELLNNQISGKIPESIGNLTALKEFDFRYNQLSGTIPGSIGNLKNLIELIGYENQLSGNLPESIGNLSSLETLWLGNNKISGSLPKSIGNATNLTYINLGNNQMDGNIPESIGNLSSLETLWLSHNKISGGIPESIGNLTSLKILWLCDNELSGEIPESIGNLASLETLYLYYNKISGGIPESIGNLTYLEDLLLENNQLNGSIPASIGNLSALKSVTLNDNMLSGKIPESITKLNFWKNNWQWVLCGNKGLDVTGCYLPVPENALTDIDGNPIFLGEEYRKNELTVLYRWGTYCGYSTSFNITLSHLYKTYRNRGLEIIGESHATDISEDIAYIRENDIPWRNCVFGYGESGIQVLATRGTPELVAIDRTGKVVFQSFTKDYKEFSDWLAEYFPSESGTDIYTSTDYSRDGEVVALQKASVGQGIDMIFMGEGFVDKDMVTDGLYEKKMKEAMEKFFSIEPYKSMRNRFNVYAVKVVSPNAEFNVEGAEQRINMNPAIAFEYARMIKDTQNPPMVTVIYNSWYDIMRSRCTMYTDGSFVSFIMGPDSDGGTLLHETGGHGFANLLDEYIEEGYGAMTLPQEGRTYLDNAWTQWGFGANVDWRNDASTVKWAHFLSDERYSNEGLGLYEGSYLYGYGAYRPNENSIMRESTKSNLFNAPSREQIYKRIMQYSEGENWKYDYEEFVKFDANSRNAASRSAVKPLTEAERREYIKNHRPPTIINGTWRDALKDKNNVVVPLR